MKNKEEPSSDLSRGNPRTIGDPSLPGSATARTIGSPVRPDDAAAASLEKPALSLFPMSLIEALVEEANIDRAWKNVKANRGASIFNTPPRWHYHHGIPRVVSSSLEYNSTTASRWHLPTSTGSASDNRQARWRQAIARYTKLNRSRDSTSHRSNPNPSLRSELLGIKLRVST